MADISFIDFFLEIVTSYGSLALSLALFLGALGLPVPGTLIVATAGALAQQGVIDWSVALGSGLLGVVLGDNISYGLGRLARAWVRRRTEQSSAWQTAQESFERRGIWAIYLTRFLLTPLAIPTNLIAGGSGYNYRRFLAYDIAGELTWLVLYGGLGYTFGSQWASISNATSDYSGWLGSILAVGAGVYLLQMLRNKGRISRINYVAARS